MIEHSCLIIKKDYLDGLNKIDSIGSCHAELEKFRLLLDSRGRFDDVLIDGISKLLQDTDSGAKKCILDVCTKLILQQNQVVLDDGG